MQTSEKICFISAVALRKFPICFSSFTHTDAPQRENYYWAFPKLFIGEILAAYIMRRGKNCLFDSILLVWCSVKKRLEATSFWKSDICNGGITTKSWFSSPFFIICSAEKKSDAIILLKSWKQSKKMLRQYKCPAVPKAAGQYKAVHFSFQCLVLHSVAFVPHLVLCYCFPCWKRAVMFRCGSVDSV